MPHPLDKIRTTELLFVATEKDPTVFNRCMSYLRGKRRKRAGRMRLSIQDLETLCLAPRILYQMGAIRFAQGREQHDVENGGKVVA